MSRRRIRVLAIALSLAAVAAIPAAAETGFRRVPVEMSVRFARLALDCVGKEYPNKISHTMRSDLDAKPPRELHPAFYGCFDWHSSVHGHWLLARLTRLNPLAPFAAEAKAALGRSLTPENLATEAEYLRGEGRATFERPYGLAWLLQLCAELHQWDDPQAERWAGNLRVLEDEAASRLNGWLPKLRYPIRTGEHSQTAFALALALDWARATGRASIADMIEGKALGFHAGDRDAPLEYEPSGQDFLSPCLAEADLMRRVMRTADFSAWLERFLPGIPRDGRADWLPVAVVTDRSDGKLAHLDGLNLSRAWMLEGIASALPEIDPRRASLLAAADAHREAGLAAVTGEHYEGGHWLGSFATYLMTGRGLDAD